MFAHVSIGVKDIQKSVAFYDKVIVALGYERLFGDVEEKFMAYGPEDSFFIINEPLDTTKDVLACNGSHLCIKAQTKEQVDGFYAEALRLGAKDSGAPGIREHYSDDYYAAFIFDPDGHKIEVLARV
ncbi:MAG TPA: VOC family protein [Alphaproteobacteria bacterium]|nr:VOC family protein [Alphaproteobacteria bacterium]